MELHSAVEKQTSSKLVPSFDLFWTSQGMGTSSQGAKQKIFRADAAKKLCETKETDKQILKGIENSNKKEEENVTNDNIHILKKDSLIKNKNGC